MNPEDAVRRLRSADRWTSTEPRFLDGFTDTVVGPSPDGGDRPAHRLRTAIVTVVVLAAIAAGTTAILQVVRPSDSAVPASPTATPSPTSTAGTAAALPKVAGAVLATWTDRSRLPIAADFDLHGKALAITVACTGGGSIQYTVVHHGDSSTGCQGESSGGPELMARDGSLIAEHRITVRVSTTGHPRFAFRLLAVPVTALPSTGPTPTVAPTGTDAPASLRACKTADLEPTASYVRWPHFQGGLLTVRSSADTDCALRAWPVLRYLDRGGAAIGAPAAREGDPADTNPPVRLRAHGAAYVQIELFTLDRLDRCGAERVEELALSIGHADVRVPVPASPVVGKCADPSTVADGVGPATDDEPTGP